MQKQRKNSPKILENERKPFVFAIFGKPHSGKTYHAERLAENYKGTVFVYNYGRAEDWHGYEVIKWIDNPKTKISDGKAVLFEYKGQVFDFKNNFMKLFRGKRVKALSANDKKEQNKIFKTLATAPELQHILFIIDDATTVLDSRLSAAEANLLAKSKHNKVDVMTIAHSLDVYPPRAYAFVNFVRLFETSSAPSQQKINLLPFKEVVLSAYEDLLKQPLYSYYTADIESGTVTRSIRNKDGKITNKTILEPRKK